ncbi:SH3 domain-containing protein [Haloferula sp.]|uniref:SH3 domain-containing protein n=1 Tax=Haloferula sp. TaxID=2497595 RepID=UPI003C789894
MPRFTANSDYEEKDSNPIALEAGDEVTVGPADRAWPGWVWAQDSQGRHGYVPEEILEPTGEGRFALMKDFDPTVLTVKRGDILESIEQIDGWHWCRNDSGAEGWVAGYLLRPEE